jgi:hypothetical protein
VERVTSSKVVLSVQQLQQHVVANQRLVLKRSTPTSWHLPVRVRLQKEAITFSQVVATPGHQNLAVVVAHDQA